MHAVELQHLWSLKEKEVFSLPSVSSLILTSPLCLKGRVSWNAKTPLYWTTFPSQEHRFIITCILQRGWQELSLHCQSYSVFLNLQANINKFLKIHLLCSFYVSYCFFSLILLFVQKTQLIQGEWHQITIIFYLFLTRKKWKN